MSSEVFRVRKKHYFYIPKRKCNSNFQIYFQQKYCSYRTACSYLYGTMIANLNSVGFSPLLLSLCWFLGLMQVTPLSQLSVELSSYLVYAL